MNEDTGDFVNDIFKIREIVQTNMDRVASLGHWDPSINVKAALLDRVPEPGRKATGFDAGIAAAMNLIPPDKQALSCVLHAAYNVDAIKQILIESEDMHYNSETCWWLAASNIKIETGVTVDDFLQQVSDFDILSQEPLLRRDVANEMFLKLKNNFKLVDGVPFTTVKYGLSGCYLAGYNFGVHYEEATGTFYIGTYHETLGLDDFPFSDLRSPDGKCPSGRVFGSRQYVRLFSISELSLALETVKNHFSATGA
ncbi:hypothetical protein KKF34_07975 [Myxococcota bacterium]|nr:hypothetical protein [Myxococcota bacterium]MBU1379396.1 hypothetical protein [Myxococcota bacterium]MBU1496798.1 hypothetical protein [Myxococcota bacterium]